MRPSPNIWQTPDVYELENHAFDRADRVGGAIDALHPLAGATLLDIGCGTGYHLPGFAARGARVLGLEPHLPLASRAAQRLAADPRVSDPLAAQRLAPDPPASDLKATHPHASDSLIADLRVTDPLATQRLAPDSQTCDPLAADPRAADPAADRRPPEHRCAEQPATGRAPDPLPGAAPSQQRRAQIVAGEAERLPFAAGSVDVVVARWAYFFGPGCEPGLAEVERVLRPRGLAAFLDNDATRSRFGAWFAASLPSYDPVAVRRFWRRQGFAALDLDLAWECPDRATFEAIVRIEFEPALAERILAGHAGTSVDYAVTLWHRRY